MIRSIFNTVDICCEGSVDFQDMSRFAAWNFTSISLLLFVAAVRHDADNAYSMQITWLCIRLFPFLTVAYNGKHYT